MKLYIKQLILVITLITGIGAQASVPSNWVVNPSSFTFNMTLIAQVNLNCELNLTQTNTLAAFVGDECRGVAVTGISGFPITQMIIYSDAINGETMTFKYYDADNDIVYNLSHTLPFIGDDIVGTLGSPEVITGTFLATGIEVSNNEVYDTNTTGDLVGVIDVTDPDTTDVYVLELLEQGDYEDFTLNGDELFLNHNPNIFLNSTYKLHFKGVFNENCIIYDSVDFNFTVVPVPVDTTDNGNGNGDGGDGSGGDGSGDGSGGDGSGSGGGGTPTYTISLSGDSIFDYTAIGDTIGQFTVEGLEMLDLNFQMLDSLNSDTNTFIISNGYLICNRAMVVLSETNIPLYIRADGGTSFFIDGELVINYTNTNIAPTAIQLTNDTVFDYSIESELIGFLSVDDSNASETYTYSFDSEGNHQNDYFMLVDNELYLNHDIDILTETGYQVHIKAFDGVAYSIDTIFTIVLHNTNSAPTALHLSNNEVFDYTVNGAFIGLFSVDDEDSDAEYSYSFLENGSVNNSFFMVSNDSLFLNHDIDILNETEYSIHIEGYDNKAYRIDTVIDLVLNNTNSAPTSLDLSNNIVFDYSEIGSFIGLFSVEDLNLDEMYSYSFLEDGFGNNTYFTVSNDSLFLNHDIDILTETGYSIHIEGYDNKAYRIDTVIEIVLNNTNSAPTSLHISNDTVFDYSENGAFIGLLSVDDANEDEVYSYSVLENLNTTNSLFRLSNDSLFLNHDIDILTETGYSIHIEGYDNKAYRIDTVIEIILNNTNSAPTSLNISNDTVFDYTVNGTFIGLLTVEDNNEDEVYSYSVLENVNTTNSLFILSNDSIYLNHNINILTDSVFSIHIEAYDGKAYRIDREIQIVLNNTNARPTALHISNAVVFDYTETGSFIGVLTVDDLNENAQYSYSILTNSLANNEYFILSNDSIYLDHEIDILTETEYSIHLNAFDGIAYYIDTVMTIVLNNTNEKPTSINLDNNVVYDYSEIDDLVGNLDVADLNNDAVYTYSVLDLSVLDNSKFVLTDGKIYLNHEVNVLTDTIFKIQVSAYDGVAYSITDTLSIVVNNTNVAPYTLDLSQLVVYDYSVIGDTVGVLTVDDANQNETYAYSLTASSINTGNLFYLLGDYLILNKDIDPLVDTSFQVEISGFDGSVWTIDSVYTISMENTNELPTVLNLSGVDIKDTTQSGFVVGSLSVTDANVNETYLYSINSSVANGNLFQIVGNDVQFIGTVNPIIGSYQVEISAYDGVQWTIDSLITIHVENTNIQPTGLHLTPAQLTDTNILGFMIGALSVSDLNLDEDYTYSVNTSIANGGFFQVIGDSLMFTGVVDPTIGSYQVEISAYDGRQWTIDSLITIHVENTNIEPSALHLTPAQLTDTNILGFMIGALSVSDLNLDEEYTYSVNTSMANGGFFQVIGDSLMFTGVVDPTIGSYQVGISAYDGVQWTIDSLITITVENTNIEPTAIHLTPAQLTDTNILGFMIGALSVSDLNTNEDYTYSVNTVVANGGFFQVVGDSLMFTGVVDPTIGSYQVEVSAYDGRQWTISELITITVENTNIEPTALHLTPAQLTDTNILGFMIGALSVSDLNLDEEYSYSVNTGVTNGGFFQVVGDSLMFTGVVDPTIGSYQVEISAYDGRQWTIDSLITITVENTNIEPTALHLTPAQITDTNILGFMIGALSVSDLNLDEEYEYSVNTSIADGGFFQVVGDSLMFTGVVDPTIGSYQVEISAYDGRQWTIDSLITITVENTNIEPTALHLTPAQITDTNILGFMIGALSVSDLNLDEEYTYSINTSLANSGFFQIVGDSLMFTGVVDPTIGSYQVEISAYDGRQWTIDSLITITVENTNEIPTTLNLSASVITDNSTTGFEVGTLSVSDANIDENYIYSINSTVANGNLFQVIGNSLQVNGDINAFTGSYQVEISAYDGRQWTIDSLFTITVNNTNSSPTDIELSENTIDENLDVQTVIGNLLAVDVGENETYVFELTSTLGENDNSNFIIEDNSLKSSIAFDYETQEEYSVEVTVTDVLNQTFTKTFNIYINDVLEVDVLENNNYLTPNGDGKNDIWELENVELYKDFDLTIYNKQGQSVYETTGYNNTWSGNDLPTGLYFYHLKSNTTSVEFSGNIHLIK